MRLTTVSLTILDPGNSWISQVPLICSARCEYFKLVYYQTESLDRVYHRFNPLGLSNPWTISVSRISFLRDRLTHLGLDLI